MKGLVKSIGNGNSTSIWCEKWIMDEIPRCPVNRQIRIDAHLKVSSLLSSPGVWNEEKLTELFPPNEVHRIKQMVPGEVEDCFVWAYTRHGAYTVKTGYGMLVKVKSMSIGQISPEEQVQNDLKKRIWKLPTLPKIRMFLWRAVSGALAVAERLNSRGLNVDPSCRLCQDGPETINHVLFQCSVASLVWSDVGTPLPAASSQRSLEENISSVFDLIEDKSKPQNIVRAIPWVMWLIWKNRNAILYAETQDSMVILLRDMMQEVDQWFLLNNIPSRDTEEGQSILNTARWSPPEHGIIKCNVHANWRDAHLHSGIAWIARDQNGNVMYHARDALVHAPNRMVAELRCIIWTMTSLVDIGVTNVIITSDYNEVLEAIKAPLQWPRLRGLLQQVIKLKEKFTMVVLEEEKIVTNGIAREIARSVLRDGRFQSYLAMGGPSWLHDRLARERM